MRVIDLFSGIGGFSVGLEQLGFHTIAFCERDEYCQGVLRRHWPEIPIHDDIRTFPVEEYRGAADLVVGGFPCQPFSSAGKRVGPEDDRYLWPAMLGVIRALRPRWVIGENVAGIVTLALDQVLSDLEDLDYTCRAYLIPACAVDAPHRRERVWIIGHTNSDSESGSTVDAEAPLGAADASDADRERPQGERDRRHTREPQGTQPWRPSAGALGQDRAVWPPEPGMDRVADGIPDRVDRLRALGNSVVPPLITAIGAHILRMEQQA